MLMEILGGQNIQKVKLCCFKFLQNLSTYLPRNKYILCAIIIVISYYGLELIILNEPAPFYLTGLLRISMSKMLIFYDWQKLKNERCLIKNFRQENIIENKLSCTFCEAIQFIPETGNWTAEDIQDIYLSNHIPVILKTDKRFNFLDPHDFVQRLLQNKNLKGTYLCELNSNIFLETSYFPVLIDRIKKIDSFFFHFQFCYFDAVKAFRSIIPRPDFMADNLHPVQYIWILSSKNYVVSKSKYIRLIERYTAIMQLFGSNTIFLKPTNKCEDDCPILEIILGENETLFFTNMWEIEYKPNNEKENLAVVFETH